MTLKNPLMSDRKLGLAGLSLQIDLVDRLIEIGLQYDETRKGGWHDVLCDIREQLHHELRQEKEWIKDTRAARRLGRG